MSNTTIPKVRPNYASEVRQRAVRMVFATKVIIRRVGQRKIRWREVPGETEGHIDEDVYEAARAFTGWSYEMGQYVTEGVTLPATGNFTYIEHWHEPYQKRVLGIEFDSQMGPMQDGRTALDLVAVNPATARHVCTRRWKQTEGYAEMKPAYGWRP